MVKSKLNIYIYYNLLHIIYIYYIIYVCIYILHNIYDIYVIYTYLSHLFWAIFIHSQISGSQVWSQNRGTPLFLWRPVPPSEGFVALGMVPWPKDGAGGDPHQERGNNGENMGKHIGKLGKIPSSKEKIGEKMGKTAKSICESSLTPYSHWEFFPHVQTHPDESCRIHHFVNGFLFARKKQSEKSCFAMTTTLDPAESQFSMFQSQWKWVKISGTAWDHMRTGWIKTYPLVI